MSINNRMDKQTVAHPYNGILLSNKKVGTIDNTQQYGWISSAFC